RVIPPVAWIQAAAAVATATPAAGREVFDDEFDTADAHTKKDQPLSSATLFELAEQPTVGKWLILALAASIFLNGYLLKAQPEERRPGRSRIPRSSLSTPNGKAAASPTSYFRSSTVGKLDEPKEGVPVPTSAPEPVPAPTPSQPSHIPTE